MAAWVRTNVWIQSLQSADVASSWLIEAKQNFLLKIYVQIVIKLFFLCSSRVSLEFIYSILYSFIS